ncbi:hypothetical protein LEN26_002062 [Aphanomyces euteiches]|nr:hypothetical protein AeMF1_017552 [Aphanomyces euteiches]KAH9159985.1 hypothetical protein LEN26_002062 [Aphanomyces euteiches]KAH9197476.1 hypothetical protein AeNC1_000531 [Aphanomyces euteiches]
MIALPAIKEASIEAKPVNGLADDTTSPKSVTLGDVSHALAKLVTDQTLRIAKDRTRPATAAPGNVDRALTKLGVTEETLRIEKLMKKLGVCDNDLQAYDDLQRHSAVVDLSREKMTKEEVLCGYSKKQMQRVKAIKSLGTTEEEIEDDHSQRVSQLGIQIEPPKESFSSLPRRPSPRRSIIGLLPSKWTTPE